MPVRQRAFTLVELLVVIGIIGVLISILLPSLNRARAQANSVTCQSNLRQMGIALEIYIDENNGLLPWGGVDNDPHGQTPWEDGKLPNASNMEYTTWWTFTLSQLMNRNTYSLTDGLVHNLSPMFRDADTISGNDFRFVSHYTANPRVLYGNWYPDSAPAQFSNYADQPILQQLMKPRKMAQIKPSTVFVAWDGSQCQQYVEPNNAQELAVELDSNHLTYNSCFILGSPESVTNYNRCLCPGQNDLPAVTPTKSETTSNCLNAQKLFNIDTVFPLSTFPYLTQAEMRFRHLNNTSLNALCLDGHVESRRVGEFMVLDVCTNYPQF